MATTSETVNKFGKLFTDFEQISLVQIALILVACWLTIYLSSRVLPWLAERMPSRFRLLVLGAVPIIRLVMLVLAVLLIVPLVFNINLQNFVLITGTAGVALGFAFKDYVSSLIAGVVAVLERPYRQGDWVRIGGDYGEVVSVGMRAITILTPADDAITIPHERIWKENISSSNDGEHTLMCVAQFYLMPEHDAEAVREALRDVALTSAYLNWARPVIVVLKQRPEGTRYEVKAYPFDMRDQFEFISDLTVRGKLAIARAGGVEVSVPVVAGADQTA